MNGVVLIFHASTTHRQTLADILADDPADARGRAAGHGAEVKVGGVHRVLGRPDLQGDGAELGAARV